MMGFIISARRAGCLRRSCSSPSVIST